MTKTIERGTGRRLELRLLPLDASDPRAPKLRQADDGTMRYSGYAAVFNVPSQMLAGGREIIAPTAFTNTLAAGPRVLFLHNHDRNLVLASTDNGTVVLRVDAVGLHVDATWANTSYARDVAVLYTDDGTGSGPFLQHMSFAFWVIAEHPEIRDGETFWIVDEVDLDGGDVSTVASPAYLQTSGEMRERAAAAIRNLHPELDEGTVAATIARTIGEPMNQPAPEPAARTLPAQPDPPAPPFSLRALKRQRATSSAPITRELNGWAFDDLWSLLDAAVVELCSTEGFNAYWYVYIRDVSDTWLVYWDSRPGSAEAALWQIDYTVDAAGVVTLGEPFQVIRKTVYLPAPEDGAEDEPPIGDPAERTGDTALTLHRQRHALLISKGI